MILKRIKSEGIAHISYFLASGNEACVIDPRRDAKIYLEKAWKAQANIKYIFETHRNEDYVIGSLEIAENIDVDIYHGPGLDWKYGTTLEDGQEFELGNLKIIAIHTPGHTDESMSYAVYDTTSGENAVMVFTGDALFVDDTGRTDMYGPEEDRRMAKNLYNSIFNKILTLGDQAILLPAHGAGSVCGASISEREHSTLGLERKQNPTLQKDKEKFIDFKMNEHHYFAPYFRMMEKYNLEGAPLLKDLPRFRPMLAGEFRKYVNQGATVLDMRNPSDFAGAHIEGSYNIWLEGLASFAGWTLSYEKPILLVVKDFANLNEAHKHLLRLGYDNIEGYLVGGITSWYSSNFPVNSTELLTAITLKERIDSNKETFILDVRSIEERNEGYIENSKHIYVGNLEERLDEVPKDKPIATYCGNGSRASLAASILDRNGYSEVYTVLGSMKAWKNAGYPIKK
ncbi:MAG: MBL fold metallo-hydrolase [Candidatus Lokiarchaeota archaeon]|nr:MBL fold metallo-hydrolase [Candidatus Lokiarchaeota archaeon]MBD3198394.1 MBL fold metallo-hydrolase [Candidatus Lokiarchaeota archaeon]